MARAHKTVSKGYDSKTQVTKKRAKLARRRQDRWVVEVEMTAPSDETL